MARGRRTPEVETIRIPHEHMLFADRRIAAIVRRCCWDENIIESISRSCYLQGVWDGVQVASAHPELLPMLAPPEGEMPHEPET